MTVATRYEPPNKALAIKALVLLEVTPLRAVWRAMMVVCNHVWSIKRQQQKKEQENEQEQHQQ